MPQKENFQFFFLDFRRYNAGARDTGVCLKPLLRTELARLSAESAFLTAEALRRDDAASATDRLLQELRDAKQTSAVCRATRICI